MRKLCIIAVGMMIGMRMAAVTGATALNENNAWEECGSERLADQAVMHEKPLTDAGAEEGMPGQDETEETVIKKSAFIEAEAMHAEAVASYENGDNCASRELYHKMVRKLNSLELDVDVYYRLKQEFDAIFDKLGRFLGIESRSEEKAAMAGSIALDTGNQLVQRYLGLYTSAGTGNTVLKALERSGRYRAMILDILREYGLPAELVYLPLVESFYNNNDVSKAGATGLWQLMPERARALGLKVNYWIDERKDPEKATRAAARYLKDLHVMFDDWHLALAAYNRGEYGLARDLKLSGATSISEISRRKAVPRETELFVPQFIAFALIGKSPERYLGAELNYEKPRSFDRVRINRVTDLKIAAQCAGTTIGDIRELNPALKAWCTPHNYPGFELRLPQGSKERFLSAMANVEDPNPHQGYIKYTVVTGDSLLKIAKRFDTSVAALQEDNRIKRTDRLEANRILLIKPGKKYLMGTNE